MKMLTKTEKKVWGSQGFQSSQGFQGFRVQKKKEASNMEREILQAVKDALSAKDALRQAQEDVRAQDRALKVLLVEKGNFDLLQVDWGKVKRIRRFYQM